MINEIRKCEKAGSDFKRLKVEIRVKLGVTSRDVPIYRYRYRQYRLVFDVSVSVVFQPILPIPSELLFSTGE